MQNGNRPVDCRRTALLDGVATDPYGDAHADHGGKLAGLQNLLSDVLQCHAVSEAAIDRWNTEMPTTSCNQPVRNVAWLRLGFSSVGAGPAPTVNEWRSVFGSDLRKQECLTGASACAACLVRASCRYARLFDTPPPVGTTWMHGVDRVPHPMLLRAAPDAGGQDAGLEVLLFGKATDDAALVVGSLARAAMQGVGPRRSRWRLRSVQTCAEAGGGWRPLDPHDPADWLIYPVDMRPPACPASAMIEFASPVRIQRQGRPIRPDALTFADLYASLLRRLSSIAYFHEGIEWEADFRGLVDRAKAVRFAERRLSWQESSRYSARQQATMPLSGILGSVRAEGDLSAFWPQLWAGQWLHVGKATMFGLGCYTVRPAPAPSTATATADKLAASAATARLPEHVRP